MKPYSCSKSSISGTHAPSRRRAVEHAVLAVGPLGDRDDVVRPVLGDRVGEPPLRLVVPLEDEFVVGLGRAEGVVHHLHVQVQRLERLALLRDRVLAVVEAGVLRVPGGGVELNPFQHVAGVLAGFEVHDLPGPPVAAGVLHAVAEVLPVVAELRTGQGDGAVVAPEVRVDQHLRLVVQRGLRVEDVLVLEAVVLVEVVPAALLERGAVLFVVPQVGQPRLDRLPLGEGLEVAERHLVLGVDPGLHVGVLPHVVFQPPIRVGDDGAVVVVRLADGLRLGIGQRGVVRGEGGGGEEREGEERTRHVGAIPGGQE